MDSIFRFERRLFNSVFIALLSLVFYFIAISHHSNFYNWLSFVFLLAIILYQQTCQSGSFSLALYAFALFFAVFSAAVIEATGIFLIEIRETPVLTGAAARGAFLSAYFLSFSYIGYYIFLKIFRPKLLCIRMVETLLPRGLIVGAVLALIYLSALLVINGSPLLKGIDRFRYFSQHNLSFGVFVYGLLPTFGLFISLGKEIKILSKTAAHIWLISCVIILILLGEKFSKFILLAFYYSLPYFVLGNKTIDRKTLRIGAGIAALLTILVVINYYLTADDLLIVASRFALQGQMMYALDGLSANAKDVSVIIHHFIGVGGNQLDSGIEHLMYAVAPADVVQDRIEAGATFTAPFPANFMFFFGVYLAPLAIGLFSLIVGFSLAFLTKAIQDKNILCAFIGIKIFTLTYVAMIMGEANLFFEPKAIVQLYAAVLLALVSIVFSQLKLK